jgi:predicted ATP-grasp superfamily ATP-dependent carboligase
MYTGAIENWPHVIERVDRPLLGNPADVIRAVRDPARFHDALAAADLAVPRIARTPEEATATNVKRWLLKPHRSAAGVNIRRWKKQAFDSSESFLQQWIDGEPLSAIFLATDGNCELFGVTRQLIGVEWLHASKRFEFAGTLAPTAVSAKIDADLRRLGATLTSAFGLRGLFGVDGVLNDAFWPIEINPRYTASVEVLERAGTWGRHSCLPIVRSPASPPTGRQEHLPHAPTPPAFGRQECLPHVHGKAILYARESFVFPDSGPWLDALRFDFHDLRVPFADIPAAGQRHRRGQPVLSFFASGDTEAATEAALRKIAADLDRALFER